MGQETCSSRYALDEESKQSQLIFITGGLGPTADDITKPLLCKYFNGTMTVNDEALENVKTIFSKYLNRPLLDSNLKQALVPDVCTVLQNHRGTAPGMWFEKDSRIFISLPGVPVEMKGIMTDYILPKLPLLFKLPAVVHRTLLTAGIGESFLAQRISEFEKALPSHIRLAYLPNFGLVKLRLTATGENTAAVTEVDELFQQLQSMVQDVMVANEDTTLEEAIGTLLNKNNATLTTAESCTGGYIAHLITSIPGSSAYFLGGVISYDNAAKQSLLGVEEKALEKNGAVSEETVIKMADGARRLMNTDYAVAVSGIMGPAGGTEEKPVGTVWIAVSASSGTIARKFYVRYDRQKNIEVTAIHALTMLRQSILSQP